MAVKAHDCKRSSYIVVASKQVFMELSVYALSFCVYCIQQASTQCVGKKEMKRLPEAF